MGMHRLGLESGVPCRPTSLHAGNGGEMAGKSATVRDLAVAPT